VRVVGSLPVDVRVVVAPATGRTVEVRGPLREEIRRLSGAEVAVYGPRENDIIEATDYQVRSVDGAPVIVGTVEAARDWQRADGRMAGSEVNRDRARMAWRVTWKDEPAVVGTSYRRYTLTNSKNNHGPKAAPLAFAAAWTFGYGDDPGELHFLSAEPIGEQAPELSPELAEALAGYEAGHRTPAPLAAHLGIATNTAKSRLRLLRERGLIGGSDD
jgi:hypothetical protein